MIKNYVPLRDAKKIHVVELTPLFGENKLVTRHYMQGDSAAEILAIYADEDSLLQRPERYCKRRYRRCYRNRSRRPACQPSCGRRSSRS